MIRLLRPCIVFLCLLTVAPTCESADGETLSGEASAMLVVIKSSSSEYKLAQLITETTTVRLDAGESLTVVAENGKSHTLSGPYVGTALGNGSSGGIELIGAIASVLGSRTDDLSTVGASRGDGGKTKRHDGEAPVWRIVLEEASTQCTIAREPVIFWRGDAGSRLWLVLEDLAQGHLAELMWAAGEHEIDWPESVPTTDGGNYRILSAVAGSTSDLVLHEIPREAAAGIHGVAFLLARGCDRQAETLWAEFSGSP